MKTIIVFLMSFLLYFTVNAQTDCKAQFQPEIDKAWSDHRERNDKIRKESPGNMAELITNIKNCKEELKKIDKKIAECMRQNDSAANDEKPLSDAEITLQYIQNMKGVSGQRVYKSSGNSKKENRDSINSAPQVNNPEQSTSAQTQPVQQQAAQTQPVQEQAAQTQPVQEQAAQTQPVQEQAEQTQPVQKQAEQTQPVQKQAEQTQPVQKQAEQTQPVQKQAEQTQPVQKQAEQTQPVQSPVRDGKQNNVVYSKPTLITTESGEQYEAQEGDSFEGEIKNGKVVQGRLYDKNGKVKKLFLIKKVH